MATPTASPLTSTFSYTAAFFHHATKMHKQATSTSAFPHNAASRIPNCNGYNVQFTANLPSTVNLPRHLARLLTSIAALSCFLRPLRDHSSCLGSSRPPIAYAHASDLALVTMQRSHAIFESPSRGMIVHTSDDRPLSHQSH